MTIPEKMSPSLTMLFFLALCMGYLGRIRVCRVISVYDYFMVGAYMRGSAFREEIHTQDMYSQFYPFLPHIPGISYAEIEGVHILVNCFKNC